MMKQNLNELWQAVYEENAEFKSVDTAKIRKRVNRAINISSDKGTKSSKHINAVLIPVTVLMVTILLAGALHILRNPERQEDDGKNGFDNVQWMLGQSSSEIRMSANDNEKETVSVPITEEYATDTEDPLEKIRLTVLKDGFYYASARKGEDVLSVCDGTVTGAGWESGYGYCVSILDADGHTWKYAHCKETLVNIGDDIHAGDLVAYAGSSGLTTENAILIKLILTDPRTENSESESNPISKDETLFRRVHPVTEEEREFPALDSSQVGQGEDEIDGMWMVIRDADGRIVETYGPEYFDAAQSADGAAQCEDVLRKDHVDFKDNISEIKAAVLNEGRYYVETQYGESIVSLCDGVVASSQYETGYGYCVTIIDEEKRVWKYGHCSELLAKEGAAVSSGDIIAYAGNSGLTTGGITIIKDLAASNGVSSL